MDSNQIIRLASDEAQHFCRCLAAVLVSVCSDDRVVLTDDVEQELAILTGQVAQLEGKIAKVLGKVEH
jgi:hypothetical protein